MSAAQLFRVGSLRFDAQSGELSAPARSLRLEPRAAAVLAMLCGRPGQIVARQALLDDVWGPGEGSDEALTQAVAQIRRTAQELGEAPGLVETLAKRGYRLNGGSANSAQLVRDVRATPSRRALIGACVVILALAALVFAAPHGLRHSIRHALGFGPATH
jgi:DNA-binding winged helix-turn-helix (wHTH) protein